MSGRRALLAKLGLAAASVVVSLIAVELALHAWGYRFSPITFLTPENAGDWRAFHMGADDPRLGSRESLTVFDSTLLWRVNPAVSPEINAQGFRGPLFPERPAAGDVTIVAVGDSNTLGQLHTNDHWPGFLDDLVRLDDSRHVRVVNAGVYGYTSFQGLRRFQQAAAYHPRLAYFSFGANDAQPVRTTDAEYAARVRGLGRWRWSRLAPLIAHVWMRMRARPDAAAAMTHRVPLEDYRRNIEAFVTDAHAAGVVPVLLTRPLLGRSDDRHELLKYAPLYNQVTRDVAAARGVALVDAYEAFKERADLFADPLHFNRVGNRRMAEILVEHLASLGVVRRGLALPSGPTLDLARADERQPELGPGFRSVERPAGGPAGRWTLDVADLTLARTKGERALALDFTNPGPLPHRMAEVLVNGRRVYDFRDRRGRLRPVLDISAAEGPTIRVRFVVDPLFVPRDRDPESSDARPLGVFVHGARLLPSVHASAVDLAALTDESPELGPGWFPPETWPDGRSGRWTAVAAELTLERRGDEDRLAIDLSLEGERNPTAIEVEIDGEVAGRFQKARGRIQESVAVARPGSVVRVRIRVADPYVPAGHQRGSADTRALGVFVHSVRLEKAR